jgi:hypothetical protein
MLLSCSILSIIATFSLDDSPYHYLTETVDKIVIAALNIRGMIKNRKLSRAISKMLVLADGCSLLNTKQY